MTDSSASLIFDENQHYACQNCPARCCRFPWKITLSQEEEEKIRGFQWVNERLASFKVDFIPFGETRCIPRVEYRPDDMGCLFLDTDNLCLLQKQEGHEALPKTCQAFPFAFLQESETPQASAKQTFTATNFFCPSILNNNGNAMAEVVTQRFQQPDTGKEVADLPPTIMLSPGTTLSQKAYLIWSRHIEQQFAKPEPIPKILLNLRQTLSDMLLALEGGNAIDDINLTSYLSEDPAKETTSTQAIPRGTIVGRIMVTLGLLHAVSNKPKQQHQQQSPLKLCGHQGKLKAAVYLLNLIKETGTIHLWDIPNDISMTAARKVSIPEHSEAFQSELRRYYRSLFLSKRIWLLEQPLPKTLLMLAASYATILRLTRYIAYSQGHSEATLQDLREAIGFSTLMLQGKTRMEISPIEQLLEKITDQLALFENTFERVLFCESAL